MYTFCFKPIIENFPCLLAELDKSVVVNRPHILSDISIRRPRRYR